MPASLRSDQGVVVMTGTGGPNALEQLAGMHRNRWPTSPEQAKSSDYSEAYRQYAAQVIVQIDADIAEKVRFCMETNENLPHLQKKVTL